jgi:hypothetical protein
MYYFMPLFTQYVASKANIKIFRLRYVAVALVAVAGIVTIALGTYAAVTGSSTVAFNYLVNRVLVFQGEIWWAVDHDITTSGYYDTDHWRTELDHLFNPGVAPAGEIGMKYLMLKILGPARAFPVFERGYLYTMAYPAILITMMPYSGALVVQFFAGSILLLILYYLHYAVIYRHAVRAVIALLILVPYVTVLFTGNFEVFFTFGMLMKAVILLVLELGGLARGTAEATV